MPSGCASIVKLRSSLLTLRVLSSSSKHSHVYCGKWHVIFCDRFELHTSTRNRDKTHLDDSIRFSDCTPGTKPEAGKIQDCLQACHYSLFKRESKEMWHVGTRCFYFNQEPVSRKHHCTNNSAKCQAWKIWIISGAPWSKRKHKLHYKNLLMAFESFVVINQLNKMARECCHKKLSLRLHKVLGNNTDDPGSHDFLTRGLNDTSKQ